MAAKSDGFKDFVLDQLTSLSGISTKAMFGGYGLYQSGAFFGIIHRGRLYLKTDEASRKAYRARGTKPFQPNRRQRLKSYYEVPVEILEDREQLAIWARTAATADA
jgi:DNA transformation protein